MKRLVPFGVAKIVQLVSSLSGELLALHADGSLSTVTIIDEETVQLTRMLFDDIDLTEKP